MENAHLRLGLLEYVRMTEKTSPAFACGSIVIWGKIGRRTF